MLSTLVTSSSIVFISLLFGAGLLVAWREFGLQRHVALWALSFMAAAVGHGLRIAGGLWVAQQGLLAMLACHASIASFALLAWGFRLRAQRDSRLVLGCWLASLLVITAVWYGQLAEWRTFSRIGTAAVDAFMVAIILATLRHSRGTARLLQGYLALYGLYIASVGVTAWLARPGGMLGNDVFIIVLSIGTPTGMIGSGILTLLIVSADLAAELRRQARTDALTGLLNRRGLEERAEELLAEPRRPSALAVVIADLDHFKSINDRLGHAAGDDVLRRFALHLRETLGARGLAGRLGGEEFVLLLADCTAEAAYGLVDTLRAGVPARFTASHPELEQVSASFGIALVQPGQSWSATLARADAALYRAKRAGRNRVLLDESEVPA
ncbi:GGDEF domain-containing protein [uncultured Pseudomonas sp.]|uniref:GGDEF domain-containing protein n=1 Tax=uncultured Pseudomonas sp. TaxID=114707 RepID=UPI0025E784A1|nr:GGDEF domain-containing protein [uncultured Pseudomonas sp.]